MLDTTQTDQPDDTVPEQVNSQDYSYNNASQDREDSQGSFNDPEDPSVSKDRDEKNAITSVLNEINQLDRESVKSVTIHMEYDKQEQDTKIDVSTEGEETESTHESSWDSNDEEDAEGMSYGNMVMYIAIAIIIIGTLVVIILGCNNSNGDEDLGNRNKIEVEKNDLVELSQKNEELHKKTKNVNHEARSESKILSKDQESQDINTEYEERRDETEEKYEAQVYTNEEDEKHEEKYEAQVYTNKLEKITEVELRNHVESLSDDEVNNENAVMEGFLEKSNFSDDEKANFSDDEKAKLKAKLKDIIKVKIAQQENQVEKVKVENAAKENNDIQTIATDPNLDAENENTNEENEGCRKKIIAFLKTAKGIYWVWFGFFSIVTVVAGAVEAIHFAYYQAIKNKNSNTPPFYVTNYTVVVHFCLFVITAIIFGIYHYKFRGDGLGFSGCLKKTVYILYFVSLALISCCFFVVRKVYWNETLWTFSSTSYEYGLEITLLVLYFFFIFMGFSFIAVIIHTYYPCGCCKTN